MRDRDIFRAIQAALDATGIFAATWFGVGSGPTAAGTGPTPLVLLAPDCWREVADTDGASAIRHVEFTLSLSVRDETFGARYEELDRLSAVVQNALEGSDLGGLCLPALTTLRTGVLDPSAPHPEQRYTLRGSFAYVIPDRNGRDTTP